MASSRMFCVYCENTFAFSSGLSRHLKYEHPEEKEKNHSLGCNMCGSGLVKTVIKVCGVC